MICLCSKTFSRILVSLTLTHAHTHTHTHTHTHQVSSSRHAGWRQSCCGGDRRQQVLCLRRPHSNSEPTRCATPLESQFTTHTHPHTHMAKSNKSTIPISVLNQFTTPHHHHHHHHRKRDCDRSDLQPRHHDMVVRSRHAHRTWRHGERAVFERKVLHHRRGMHQQSVRSGQ